MYLTQQEVFAVVLYDRSFQNTSLLRHLTSNDITIIAITLRPYQIAGSVLERSMLKFGLNHKILAEPR